MHYLDISGKFLNIDHIVWISKDEENNILTLYLTNGMEATINEEGSIRDWLQRLNKDKSHD